MRKGGTGQGRLRQAPHAAAAAPPCATLLGFGRTLGQARRQPAESGAAHPTYRQPQAHHHPVDVARGVVRVDEVALQVAQLDELVHAAAQQRRLRAGAAGGQLGGGGRAGSGGGGGKQARRSARSLPTRSPVLLHLQQERQQVLEQRPRHTARVLTERRARRPSGPPNWSHASARVCQRRGLPHLFRWPERRRRRRGARPQVSDCFASSSLEQSARRCTCSMRLRSELPNFSMSVSTSMHAPHQSRRRPEAVGRRASGANCRGPSRPQQSSALRYTLRLEPARPG